MMRNTWETGHTHTTEIESDNHSHKLKDNRINLAMGNI